MPWEPVGLRQALHSVRGEVKPRGLGLPCSPVSSVRLPAGASGEPHRATAEERVSEAWRPLPKQSWEGRECDWTCGNVEERSAFRGESPPYSQPQVSSLWTSGNLVPRCPEHDCAV